MSTATISPRQLATTIVVAASDSKETWRASWDDTLGRYLICDGVNDQVVIQAANAAANGGRVVVLDGTFHIDDDLTIDNCTLDGLGPGGPSDEYSTNLLVADTKTIIVTRGSSIVGRLRNLAVTVPDGFTGEAVEVVGAVGFGHIPDILDNIRIWNPTYDLHAVWTGTALLIQATATATTDKYISMCTFGAITIYGFDIGIQLSGTDHVAPHLGFVNGNIFESLVINRCDEAFITAGTGATSGNMFSAVEMETVNGATNGVHFGANSNGNIMHLHDWTSAGFYTGNSLLIDAGATLNHVYGIFNLDEMADNGTETTIEETHATGYVRVVTVNAVWGHYKTLADAMDACFAQTPSATKRFAIHVYGSTTETASVTARSYIDVIGHNAVIGLGTSYGLGVGAITDTVWRNIIAKRSGVSNTYGQCLMVVGGDRSVIFENCQFINECTGAGYEENGVLIRNGDITFRDCYAEGGQNGPRCCGWYWPYIYYGGCILYHCKGKAGSSDSDCAGFWCYGIAAPVLVDCVGEAGSHISTYPFFLTADCAPKLLDCKAKLIETGHTWSYDDANNGRFQPYAGTPYQIVGIEVFVNVAHPGQTIDIGTAIGGNQIIAGVSIATTGIKDCSAFSREELAADGYMYATPSAAISDGDVSISYRVIENWANCRALYCRTTGRAIINGGSFLANGASDALYLHQTATRVKITNAHFETFDPVNQYAIVAGAAMSDVPVYECTLVGGLSNVSSFAQEIAYGGAEFTANAFQYPAPGTDWTPQVEGAHLAANLAAKKCWLPLNFLKIGDRIISYRLVGDAVETTALTLDCKLVRVNKADPLTTTDVPGGAITQVDADGNFDSEAVLTNPEVVATDHQYTLEILGTTGAGDTITVMGTEVKVDRLD